MKLAIDFGTCNTVIASWSEAAQAARTVRLDPFSQAPLEGVPPVIPSLLYVEDAVAGQPLVGSQVRDAGLDAAGDRRYFRGFKRAIAAEIQGFAPALDGVEVTPALAGE